jgi:predicted dehydrogenase
MKEIRKINAKELWKNPEYAEKIITNNNLYLKGYYNEIRYFAHCIKNNIPPSVITPEESVECLKVLESLRESIKRIQKITVK